MITISNVSGQLKVVYPNRTEYYQFPKLSNLCWVLNEDGFYYVQFTYEDDYFVKLKLSNISNQPAWTNTQPGAELAVNTIASWIGTSFSTSLLATEATLLQVLGAVDSMRDYEVRLVEDSTTPNKVTWLEVRYWDAQTGALGAPQYYLPGSSTTGSPVLPISYINDRTLLTQILAALQGTLTVAGTVALDTPTLTALENITVQNGSGAAAVNIQDGGNAITVDDGGGSITVDGTITTVPSGTQNVSITSSIALPVTDNGGSITVDGTVAATQSGTWNINNITGTVSLPTGAATETTLAAVNTKLTATTRTHNTLSATGAGSVPSGSLRGSVLNAGSAVGTWNGISLPAGVAIPWDAVGPRDTYGVIAYNATGTTFIIEYTT